MGFSTSCRPNRLSFDPIVWKRDNYQAHAQKKFQLSDATRDRMVADLVNRYQLADMRKTEIVNLLGEPDFRNKEPFKDWDMIYWLGPDERGLAGALDSKWLVLKLDSTGKVTQYKVAVD
jgi:hypothetical protein